MPQYFKENNPIINLGIRSMSNVRHCSIKEERNLTFYGRRCGSQLEVLLNAMRNEAIQQGKRFTASG
jgi:hypothetical protein